MSEKISDILYMERHKRRESLKTTGVKIGCSAIYLSEIETGKRLPIDGEILHKLAYHYGISFENLMRVAYNQKCDEIIGKYKGVNHD